MAESTSVVVEGQDNTSAFLSDLLGSIGMGKSPEKGITDLNLKLLTKIVSFVPLRERMNLSYVSQQMHGAVRASVTSLNFYRDSLDCLPDDQIKEMLKQYGNQITGLNFDLFKSTYDQETSQWVWRQTVTTFAGMCPNLTELSILICNRHRLRDKDLATIFEKCPKLTKLCVDSQFLNGHCFKKAPISLSHIELEMCYRISDMSLRTLVSRFRKMKTLHMSQLLILSDAHINLLVRNLRQLEELSIVSHVDTKFESLSGSGLGELGKLQKLRVLCLEGIAAVTDRTLTMISDPQVSPTASTITTLSLAFCFNVSQHGLKHLGRMTSLVDLNIDGITKRDVSMGVEKIAAEGRLVRLFVAERTNISPETLLAVVTNCSQLRLLDISNNEECFNWVTADKIMHIWCKTPVSPSRPSSRRAPLTILTDEHLAWNCVGKPEKDEYGRTPLVVVHINRAAVPESELLPTNTLSDMRPSELPPGLLAPHIRRGNRYRLLWAPLGPSKDIKVELFDEQDQGVSVTELALRAAQNAAEALDRSYSSLEEDDVSSSYSMEGVESGLFSSQPPAPQTAAELSGGWTADGEGNEENMKPLWDTCPADFSISPISAEGDPHTKDWSMDVISLLLKTYAFEDGAMIGPMAVREGVIMRPDGTVEDICNSILQVDASLRARYHMTSDLGAQTYQYGTHTMHNSREAQAMDHLSAASVEISYAIEEFLSGYVPEADSSGSPPLLPARASAAVHPPVTRLNLRPRQGKAEFPMDQEVYSPHTPSCYRGGPDGNFGTGDGQAFLDYGHCENQPPASAAADAYGFRMPVPVKTYGSRGATRPDQGQFEDDGSLQRRSHPIRDVQETMDPMLPLVDLSTGHDTPFSSFAAMHQGDSLLPPAPPSSSFSSFPFPPPSYLLAPPGVAVSAGAARTVRPYGRLRGGVAGTVPAPNPWPTMPSPSKISPSHPYADSSFRPRYGAAPRSSALKPKNG